LPDWSTMTQFQRLLRTQVRRDELVVPRG